MQHYTTNLRNCRKVRYNLQLHVIRGDYNIIDKRIHISIHMHDQSIPLCNFGLISNEEMHV